MYVFDRILANAAHIPHRLAVKSSDKVLTYGELGNMIRRLAGELSLTEPEYGERILILLPNGIEFITCFFAITYAGKVAILADTKFKQEIDYIIRDNNVRRIITDVQGEKKVKDILKNNYPHQVHIITVEELSYTAHSEGVRHECRVQPEDPAMVLYTSGSTDRPKGVVNTHRTLESACKNYLETLPISMEDRLVAVTPFFHSYAFGSCMLAGLAAGATLLVQDIFKPGAVLKLIEHEQATIFQGVPYMYYLMIQKLRKEKYNMDSLRFCISAGAPLTQEIAESFYNLAGKVIHQEYGSSETGTIALNLSQDVDLNIESVGKALANVQIKIEEQTHDNIGAIHIKSTGKAVGYVGRSSFEGEWYNTGDLGKVDENGYLYIVGRKKRMINTAGLKVDPMEVEGILLQHPRVLEVLVRGTKHDIYGEVVEALVVPGDNDLDKDELKKFCQQSLASYKVPRSIQWVQHIPKSSLGKTKYW